MILITGATGNVGRALTSVLAKKAIPARAMTRDAAKARQVLPSGIALVEAAFEDAASMAKALQGVSAMVLISPAHPEMVLHQKAALDAAKVAGVRDVVKLSGLGASIEAPIRLPKGHAEIENYGRNLGLVMTPVRPNLFMQVLLGDAASIAGQGKIYAPAGSGKISFTDVRDIAEVIATLLEKPELRGVAYDITGPEALTYAEAAAKIGLAAGYLVEHVDVADEDARQAMLGMGMDPWVVEAFVELFGIYRAGYGADVLAANIAAVLGRPARSFDGFAADFRKAFAKAF
jgi:uncharacterized protein YbjT (DUF2867 family)